MTFFNLAMYNNMMQSGWGFGFFFMMFILLAWSFVWKGWSLWIAAKNGSKPWFVVLLLINTLGILEILYIFVFSKMKKKS